MKNKHSFLKGALVGALVALLVTGVASCGIKRIASFGGSDNPLDGETQKKLTKIQKLIDEDFRYDVDTDALREGIYKGYVSGLDDPYSVYYDK